MELLEGIYTRRSIRKFTDEKLSDEEIKVLLECAMLAPSAKNERPWHFVIVKDKERRMQLAKASPYSHMAANAPLVIVVCTDLREEKVGEYWVQDCSAATENLLLAARAFNIGSVWCGIYNEPDRIATVKKILNMPEEVIPLNIICLGYSNQPFSKANRFMPERVHHEKW